MRLTPPTVAWVLALAAGCGLVGCGGEAEAPAAPPARPPSRVATAPVEDGPLLVRHRLTGRTVAAQEATLAAGADGAMRRILVRVGDRVEAGDLLFEVDPGILRADLAAVQATAATAAEEEAQAARDAARFRGAGPEAVAASEIEQAESRAEQLARRARRAERARAPDPLAPGPAAGAGALRRAGGAAHGRRGGLGVGRHPGAAAGQHGRRGGPRCRGPRAGGAHRRGHARHAALRR
ncbi:MAG: biotin/lipoyl-binding protein [Sandaracinaceae bacterium]|nr:biotin/lipoyl-binding protein [Sandaracinaceae bacterium]